MHSDHTDLLNVLAVYAVLRIYSLWDQRKGTMYALVAGFVVCYGTLFVMVGLALKDLFRMWTDFLTIMNFST